MNKNRNYFSYILLLLFLLPIGLFGTSDVVVNTSSAKNSKATLAQKIAFKKFSKKINKDYAGNIKNIEGCEWLYLKNGEKIQVEIISMDERIVIYQLCNKEESGEIKIALSEVSKIEDETGDLIFKSNKKSQSEKHRRFAIASLILGILGLFPIWGTILAILALIFGIIAFRKFRQNPEESTNKKLALAGIILGSIGILLPVALLLVFLIIFFL